MAEQQKTGQAASQQESSAVAQKSRDNREGREGTIARSRMPATLMALSPYDLLAASPFQIMRRMMEEMDRMFAVSSPMASATAAAQIWSPPIEVAQRDGTLVVTAELPGLNKDDVKVELTPEGLLIQGERKEEHEEKQKGVLRTERRYGRFSRLIPLPEEANVEQAKAQFTNGVLEVVIPVSEEKQQRRQIPIESGGSQSARAA
jgi:HSP20 family protein